VPLLIATIFTDGSFSDVEIDEGDSSLEEAVYETVQRILDLVRTVKVPSKSVMAPQG